MAENSKIEWTDHTFNPWWGCVKVSAGCEHCYAERDSKRYGKDIWGPAATTEREMRAESYWRQPAKWNAAAQTAGVRARVFCASMADVFEDHSGVIQARQRLFEVIDGTPWLDWLLLTKRPENIRRLWPFGWYDGQFSWPNVWIGTSVENQAMADKRIPKLLRVPAAVRFLSCEPLLGPVDLTLVRDDEWMSSPTWHPGLPMGTQNPLRNGIDWVIVGGESGHLARPMHPDWARSLRDQCVGVGVPFFFKQWGEYIPRGLLTQAEYANLSNSVYVNAKPIDGDQAYRVGKKAAGRLLDGVEWSEFPEVKVTA